MSELFTSDLVRIVLTEDPITRANDKLLIWGVWERQCGELVNDLDFTFFVQKAKSPTVIVRSKEKLQKKFPALRADNSLINRRIITTRKDKNHE